MRCDDKEHMIGESDTNTLYSGNGAMVAQMKGVDQ
jgi:hypothetical protein